MGFHSCLCCVTSCWWTASLCLFCCTEHQPQPGPWRTNRGQEQGCTHRVQPWGLQAAPSGPGFCSRHQRAPVSTGSAPSAHCPPCLRPSPIPQSKSFLQPSLSHPSSLCCSHGVSLLLQHGLHPTPGLFSDITEAVCLHLGEWEKRGKLKVTWPSVALSQTKTNKQNPKVSQSLTVPFLCCSLSFSSCDKGVGG